MRKAFALPSTLIAAAILAAGTSGFAPGQQAQAAHQRVDYRSIAGVKELRGVLVARPMQPRDAARLGLGPGQVAARASAARNALAAFTVERYVAATDEYVFRVPPGETENDVANRLLASGDFEYVEPDWRVWPVDCPDDPSFGSQWHHQANRLASCAAWDIETGAPSIVVAICDTGVRATHEDLQLHRREGFHAPSNTWENAGGPVDDFHGHGTSCAGSAAANGDNGLGVSGVGWNLGYRPVRVTDQLDGSASLSNLTLGARTAVDAGDKVASVSFSGGDSGSVNIAGAYIRSRGGLLVWAAGNDGLVFNGNREDDVILVGATSPNDTLAGFSNSGSLVDLVAPGVGILSTSNSGDSAYSAVSGTSFACPLTAGLCALIWSRNPLLAPEEVEDLLRAACEDLGPSGVDSIFGYGRINAERAMRATPPPLIGIAYPQGRPQVIDPQGGDTITVRVHAGTQVPVAGAGEFWVDSGAGFQQAPAAFTAPGTYVATFPPVPCPSTVHYYFNFPLQGGGAMSSPFTAPGDAFSAQARVEFAVLTDPLEAPSGWTVGAPGDTATEGIWERVVPLGTSAQVSFDHSADPAAFCFVTGQTQPAGMGPEANDVDGGATSLVSPRYDLSGLSRPWMSYWRSYSNDQGSGATNADVFVVSISNDNGATWTVVETLGPTGPGTSKGWMHHAFDVSDVVTPTGQMRLKFVASDFGSPSLIEAAVDDLVIFDACASCGSALYCASAVNSTGMGAMIGFSGSTSFAANNLVLSASHCPPSQNALFIYSPDAIIASLGNGYLCVGTSTLGFIGRLGVITANAQGDVAYAFDNTSPPAPQTQVHAGETWNFQLWYRDPLGGGTLFNFSNGLSITFCP